MSTGCDVVHVCFESSSYDGVLFFNVCLFVTRTCVFVLFFGFGLFVFLFFSVFVLVVFVWCVCVVVSVNGRMCAVLLCVCGFFFWFGLCILCLFFVPPPYAIRSDPIRMRCDELLSCVMMTHRIT